MSQKRFERTEFSIGGERPAQSHPETEVFFPGPGGISESFLGMEEEREHRLSTL